MDPQIIGAVIGASATVFSGVLVVFLNHLSKKHSEKQYRDNHQINDISGIWQTKWKFDISDKPKEYQDTIYLEMEGKHEMRGKGGNERWKYEIEGSIDEMGIVLGTWHSTIDSYKGTFILKIKPSRRRLEGYVTSLAFEEDFRHGTWVWESKGKQ